MDLIDTHALFEQEGDINQSFHWLVLSLQQNIIYLSQEAKEMLWCKLKLEGEKGTGEGEIFPWCKR